MLEGFLVPLIVVGLAELGDKTQLSILCLSSKTKKNMDLLLGVVLAFAVADGLAIIFGDFIAKALPMNYIKMGAGLVFIAFGIMTFLSMSKEESAENSDIKNPFLSAFGLVLISEMGDKTQIATGLFATQYNPYFVFAGVMTALTALSLMAIYIGKILVGKIDKKKLSIAAGTIFVLIGIMTFFSQST